MTLPELSIRRHVFAFMLNAVLILFGVIAYERIGVDKLPYIEFPVISVTTTQRGANPDVIDSSITNLIETAVNGVPGIEHIQSTSSPGARGSRRCTALSPGKSGAGPPLACCGSLMSRSGRPRRKAHSSPSG